jgi:hypothetical protein
MENKRLLLILRLFYQGLKLITTGLKREIDAIEAEMSAKPKNTDDSLGLNPRPTAKQ